LPIQVRKQRGMASTARHHLFPKLEVSISERNAAKAALVCLVTACPPLLSSFVRQAVPSWMPQLFAFVAVAGCRTVGATIRFVQVFGVWVSVGMVVRVVLAMLISHETAELGILLAIVALAAFAPDEDQSDHTKVHAFRLGLLSMEVLVQGCRDGLPEYNLILQLAGGSATCMEPPPLAVLGAVMVASVAVWPLVHLPVAMLLWPHFSSKVCVTHLKAALEELAGVLEGSWGSGLSLSDEQRSAARTRLGKAKAGLRAARGAMAGFKIEVAASFSPGQRARLEATQYSLDLGYGLSDQLLLLADSGSGIDCISQRGAELARSLALEIMPATATALRLLCRELLSLDCQSAEEVCRAKDGLALAAAELSNHLEVWRSAYIDGWRTILAANPPPVRQPSTAAECGEGGEEASGDIYQYHLDTSSLSEGYSALYAFLFMASSLEKHLLAQHGVGWAAEGWINEISQGSLSSVGIYALEKGRTLRRAKNAARAAAAFTVLTAIVHIPQMPVGSVAHMLITASSMMSQGYGTLGGVAYRGLVRSAGLLLGAVVSLLSLYMLAGNTAAMLLGWFLLSFTLTRLYDGAAHPYSIRYAGQTYCTSSLPTTPMTAPPPPAVMLSVLQGTGLTLAGAAATFVVNLLVFPHRSLDMAVIKTAAALKHAGYQIQAMVCSVASGMPVQRRKVEEMVIDLTERVGVLKALLAVAEKERLVPRRGGQASLDDLSRCCALLEALVPDLRMMMRTVGTGFHNPQGRVYSLYLHHLAPQLQDAGAQIAYSLQDLGELVQGYDQDTRQGGSAGQYRMLPDLGPLAATYQDLRIGVREAAVAQGWVDEEDFVEAVMDSENLLISMNAFVVTVFHCVRLISQASRMLPPASQPAVVIARQQPTSTCSTQRLALPPPFPPSPCPPLPTFA